jgi:hypothetical protein
LEAEFVEARARETILGLKGGGQAAADLLVRFPPEHRHFPTAALPA